MTIVVKKKKSKNVPNLTNSYSISQIRKHKFFEGVRQDRLLHMSAPIVPKLVGPMDCSKFPKLKESEIPFWSNQADLNIEKVRYQQFDFTAMPAEPDIQAIYESVASDLYRQPGDPIPEGYGVDSESGELYSLTSSLSGSSEGSDCSDGGPTLLEETSDDGSIPLYQLGGSSDYGTLSKISEGSECHSDNNQACSSNQKYGTEQHFGMDYGLYSKSNGSNSSGNSGNLTDKGRKLQKFIGIANPPAQDQVQKSHDKYAQWAQGNFGGSNAANPPASEKYRVQYQ